MQDSLKKRTHTPMVGGLHALPDDKNLILFVSVNNILGIKGAGQSAVMLAMRT